MHHSHHEGFSTVRANLDFIYDEIVKVALEIAAVQSLPSISTKPRARNFQVPPTTINARIEDVNSSLQQLQGVAVDIDKLSTQTLVHMQWVANQELADI